MTLHGMNLEDWRKTVFDRMGYEFFSAGYPSTKVSHDKKHKDHPLHHLFVKTSTLIATISPFASTFSAYQLDTTTLDFFTQDKEHQIMAAKNLFAQKKKGLPTKMFEEKLMATLPRHEEVLALRFTAFRRTENRIVDMLADCNSLHLWSIPRTDEAKAQLTSMLNIGDEHSNIECALTKAASSPEETANAAWLAFARGVEAVYKADDVIEVQEAVDTLTDALLDIYEGRQKINQKA